MSLCRQHTDKNTEYYRTYETRFNPVNPEHQIYSKNQATLIRQLLRDSHEHNWRRPLGRPHTTWMKTVQQDSKSDSLSLNKAIDMTQNGPLLRLVSARNDDDDDDTRWTYSTTSKPTRGIIANFTTKICIRSIIRRQTFLVVLNVGSKAALVTHIASCQKTSFSHRHNISLPLLCHYIFIIKRLTCRWNGMPVLWKGGVAGKLQETEQRMLTTHTRFYAYTVHTHICEVMMWA